MYSSFLHLYVNVINWSLADYFTFIKVPILLTLQVDGTNITKYFYRDILHIWRESSRWQGKLKFTWAYKARSDPSTLKIIKLFHAGQK